MRLFFTTDIHGSERCFRKMLNAAKAYRADALVLGGDITGKLLVPIITEDDGRVSASMFGQVRYANSEEEIAGLEKDLRQSGSYTIRITRSEKDAIDGDEAAVEALFQRAVVETVRVWSSLANAWPPTGSRCSSARATTTSRTSTRCSAARRSCAPRRARWSSCPTDGR